MNEETIANMSAHCRRLLRTIEARHWAFDEQGWEALATISAAWLEQKLEAGERFSDDSFKQFLSELVDAVPSLKQQRNGAAPQLPEPWLHPITKQPLVGVPKTVDERGVLAERAPALLRLLEDLEAKPYATIARLNDEAGRAARLSAINYGEAEHKTNPYLMKDLQAITALVRQDPERAAVFKREAEPVKLPWQVGDKNLTEIGQLVKKSPQLAKLANRAAELQRQRIAERRAEAQRLKAQAEQRLRETEKQLAR